ncbi:MAG: 4-hydroxy-tetrahydrodipicolinate synthase [Actinobacteria bacterium]|nr:4-hydroxy-tetrahydrodipicolinate synthase [Actinomycetota bacterium]MCA1721134.1 4-hydroxy-tetrahydrodipicolinate synthase [Actinomycetota bacterium]
MTAPFGRVLTAMVTPFAANGSLDVERAGELAQRLVDLGNDGLVVSGTTGESPTTTDAEKDALLRAVVEAVGDRAHVVAGVGTYDTAHTVAAARAAERAGAAGVLVVTPYYNKPPQAGLLAHFTTVADSTGLPLMLYDIPGRTGTPIEHDTLLRLAEHPRIVANKDAKADVFAAQRVIAQTDLAYYSGDDALNLPLLACGAVGVVSVTGHLIADRHAAVADAVEAGDLVKAREINDSTLPVTVGIMTRTQGAIMVKAALSLLGFSVGSVRLPLVEATPEQLEVLRTDLAAGGVL